jgi:hypothetical protein
MGTKVEFATEPGYSQGPTTGIQACHQHLYPVIRTMTLGHLQRGSERMSRCYDLTALPDCVE